MANSGYINLPVEGGGGGGSGTVTSVGLSAPNIFSVSGSPVTSSGILSLSLVVENANKVWAGPATGADATPTFRALVIADLPGSIPYSKLSLSNSILNADINSSAAIAYSKLALTGSILNADINASAAIAYSKLALTGSILNADINASAAIAYSKLALTGAILNADINASAAIAYSKLALSNSIVNADINSSAAIAYSKLALTGTIVNADVSASAAIAFSKLATLSSANIIVGNGSNVATAVAVTGDVTISNAGVTTIAANQKIMAISFTIDGGGATISTGSKGYVVVPYACTINNNTLVADQSGSIVLDIKKSTYSGFPSTATIVASAPPTLSSAQKSQDTTLTGWTTSVAAGDILEWSVTSATTVTRVTNTLKVTKT